MQAYMVELLLPLPKFAKLSSWGSALWPGSNGPWNYVKWKRRRRYSKLLAHFETTGGMVAHAQLYLAPVQ